MVEKVIATAAALSLVDFLQGPARPGADVPPIRWLL